MLVALAGVVEEATSALESYDHGRALERTESFFWTFCDDNQELVKARAYGEVGDHTKRASAHMALRKALSVMLRLFAPVLAYVTEEVWSWWQPGSVHRAPWPDPTEVGVIGGNPGVLEVASWVLSGVRRAKSAARVSMRAPVGRILVRAEAGRLSLVSAVADDLSAACALVGAMDLEESSGEASVLAELA
jgi:valyl-tRNA synthetase